jgi:hypothetical protein
MLLQGNIDRYGIAPQYDHLDLPPHGNELGDVLNMPSKGEGPLLMGIIISLSNEIFAYLKGVAINISIPIKITHSHGCR